MKKIPLKTIFVHYFKLLFQLVVPVLLVSACDSFVEVELPKSQLTSVTVFDNYATAEAALTDIYSKMRDQGLLSGTSSGLSHQLGCYGDELTSYAPATGNSVPFYNNTLLATNITISEYWNNSYNHIYATNAILEGSSKSTALSANQKELLKAECLFIRALIHFYLVNLYGEIPFIDSTDYKTNATVAKNTTAEVYSRIISDLEASGSLLAQAYDGAERIRPNQFSVKALLARVYLYDGKWAQASNAASAVLNASGLYALEDNPVAVFLKSSKETIWQFQPSIAGKNTDEAATFIFTAGPPTLVALADNLVNSFATTDLRKTSWIKAVTKGSSVWYHANKYKLFNNTPSSLEYPIVLRLAEQYLIRAEARAREGDFIGAKEDLNRIRKRAGLNESTAGTQVEILTAIRQERRWELFTEYGHRFFDLKRSAEVDAVLSAVKPGWNPTDVLFPLPQNELSVNPNLSPQNKGY